jgi:hypothetical protein
MAFWINTLAQIKQGLQVHQLIHIGQAIILLYEFLAML